MVKRKQSGDDSKAAAKQVPLPIQIFLWRQTSPFIRPKLTRLYEATCVSFERVLVENKLHGLSPSLSDAIASVSRWQLVQASVPHLFHCCATLLNNRAKLGHADKLGVAETKILHTLHWALLDAPEECMQKEEESKGVCQLHVNHEGEFIYPLTTIQLFVYLFAPLVYCLRESDLSFRLASGLKVWKPMWDHKQPDIPCFALPVKPRRLIRVARRKLVTVPALPDDATEKTEDESEVFAEDQQVAEVPPPLPEEPPPDESAEEEALDVQKELSEGEVVSESPSTPEEGGKGVAPLAEISEVVSITSDPPVTPSDTPSVSVEIVCEVCNSSVGQSRACNCGDLKVTAGDLFTKIPRKSSTGKTPGKPVVEGKLIDIGDESTPEPKAPRPLSLPVQGSASSTSSQEPTTSAKQGQTPAAATLSDPEVRRPAARLHDTCAASHFDVAVMRCLFNPSWSEEGILWALNYILNRLRQIADENTAADRVRQRSNSSPIPQITVCLFSPAPGMPHKKFSEPADLLIKSTKEIREQKELEKEREGSSLKKIKLEPIKLAQPKKTLTGMETVTFKSDRRSSQEKLKFNNKSLKKPSRGPLSKSVGSFVPKLIQEEEVEDSKSTSRKEAEDAAESRPLLERTDSESSFTSPKLEPFQFKIDVVKLKTLPSLSPASDTPMRQTGFLSQESTPLLTEASEMSQAEETTTTSSFGCKSGVINMASVEEAPSFFMAQEVKPMMFNPQEVKPVELRPGLARMASIEEQEVTFPIPQEVRPISLGPSLVPVEEGPTMISPEEVKPMNLKSSSHTPVSRGPFMSPAVPLQSPPPTGWKGQTANHSPERNGPSGFLRPMTISSPQRPFINASQVHTALPLTPAGHGGAPARMREASKPMQFHKVQAQAVSLSDWSEPSVQSLQSVTSGPVPPRPTLVSPNVATVSGNRNMVFPSTIRSPATLSERVKPSSKPVFVTAESKSTLKPIEVHVNVMEKPPTPLPGQDGGQGNLPPTSQANGIKGKSSLTIPATVLPRSASDTFVNYTVKEEEETAEAAGSTYYIQENGHMNFSVIIKALHTIISTETSARVCDVALNIIDTLLEFSVVQKGAKPSESKVPIIKVEGEKVKGGSKEGDSDISTKGLEEMTVHNLVLETLLQIFRALGCQHGCGEGVRGQQGDRLRLVGQQCLYRLFKIDPSQFRRYLRYVISAHPLEAILDFLHALLGFCEDPAPMSFRPGTSSGTGETSGGRAGFATNFGSGIAGTGTRGIEGTIVGCTLKSLITRLVDSKEELLTLENEAVYADARQLLHYIREVHGGVFRRVAFSGLIDSAGKGIKDVGGKDKDGDSSGSKTDGDKGSISSSLGKEDGGDVSPGTKLRRNLFKKKYRPMDSVDFDSEGTGPKRRFSVFQFAQAVTTWRNKAAKSQSGGEDSPQDTPDMNEKSKKEIGGASYSGKKKVGDHPFFSKFGKKTKRDPNDDRDECGTPKSVDDEEETSDSVDMGSEKERKPVDKIMVVAGMKRLQFLMDCLNPGTVPDPEFLAAALDLRAPVVARAALFIECCHFVHRCNHGDWPEWMKMNTRGRGRVYSNVWGGRGSASCYRKTQSLQRSAAKLFYLWAEAVGNRLEELERQQPFDCSMVVGRVRDEGFKRRLRREDDAEDYLNEAAVNPTGHACPPGLKFIACQLLLEVTSFLRDTYQHLPKPRKSERNTGRFRDSEFLNVPTFSVQPSPSGQRHTSGSSTTSSPPNPNPRQSLGNTGLDSPAGERKISFAVMPDEDSQHSSNTELNAEQPLTTTTTTTATNEERKSSNPSGRKQSKGLLRRHPAPCGLGRDNRSSFRGRHKNSNSRPETLYGLGPLGSVKGRKVSSISMDDDSTGETSSVFSEQVSPQDQDLMESTSTPDGLGLDDVDLSKNMTWIPIVLEIAGRTNIICNHQQSCHPNCLQRQKRNCYRLMKAVKAVYGEESGLHPKDDDIEEKLQKLENKGKRKAETNLSHSTLKSFRDLRRESTSSTLDRQVSMFGRSGTSRANSGVQTNNVTIPVDLMEVHKVEDTPTMKYMKTQAVNPYSSPMEILCKAAPLLSDDLLADAVPLAWEVLLDDCQQLASAAAAMVLICAVKIPDQVNNLVVTEMQHFDPGMRVDAIQRFATLWRFRHQVWPHMEDKASMTFKVPPPSIDFTVPSPTLGVNSLPVLDPPWMPTVLDNIDEVSTDEESRGFAAVAVSRTHQRMEHLRKNWLKEEERKRHARETYHLMNVPIIQQSAHEPSHHSNQEEEEDAPLPVSVCVGQRRVSIAPPSQAAAAASSMGRVPNLSARRASLWSGTLSASTAVEEENQMMERTHHTPPTFGVFFPSSICSAVVQLTSALDDSEVNLEGVAVSDVAYSTLWNCLVEEPALICRYILEKITCKGKQEELILLMKRMFSSVREIPSQVAHTLFNYLIGFVIYHCRAPHSGASEAVANTLSILWHIVPFVSGLTFKDIKQTLKKEQCDPTLLVSANVPCAKRVIIHGPNEMDIPTQLPIAEEMQFEEIHIESLDFFKIDPEEHNAHFLVDKKTNQMVDVKSYVRDFYAYKRSQYPELMLKKMEPLKGLEQLQRQAFTLKLSELGRVYFSWIMINTCPPEQLNTHMLFLHDELIRLPSFPRKSLDAEFALYNIPRLGGELFGLDTMHKYQWIKLINSFFKCMTKDFPWMEDIQLFLNVLNGALLLHSEDMGILRLCLASYINVCVRYKQIFATKGFQYIMPTILRVYSQHQNNPMVCGAIKFVCEKFYLLHMKPFILQTFGSVAPLLLFHDDGNPLKIPIRCFYKLIQSLEKESPDHLDILDLVDGEKPLKTLDFCYSGEHENSFTFLEAVRLCVVVVAYAPESTRSGQMLTVLDSLLPLKLQEMTDYTMNNESPQVAKDELTGLMTIGGSIKALIAGAEGLARSTGPSRKMETATSNMTTSFKSSSNSQQTSVRKVSHKSGTMVGVDLGDEDMREDFTFRYNDERVWKRYEDDSEDAEVTTEFCRPRDMLLSVVATFFSHSLQRMKELRAIVEGGSRSNLHFDLLDTKSHLRLSEVALTLLKVAPHDPIIMGCKGLQRYLTKMIPMTDWSNQDLRPALIQILKRLDKLFQKIHKKPTLMRQLDWESAANFLKGLYATLTRQSIISHLPHLKSLLNICLTLLLCDGSAPGTGDGLSLAHVASSEVRFTPPPIFCSAVIRLVAMQMHCMKDLYTLEQVFGGTAVFNSAERTETILLYMVLPLCLRVGCGRKDCPKIRPSDVSFSLTMVLYALLPPQKQTRPTGGSSSKGHGHYSSFQDLPSHTSVSFRDGSGPVPDSLYEAAFLGLKILMICFQEQLSREWFRMAAVIKEVGSKMLGGIALWSFLDFVITVKSPLYVLLKPFIAFRMMKMICETDAEVMLQQYVGQKLRGLHVFSPKSKADMMLELAKELQHHRDNMFVPRDHVKFQDERVALAEQRTGIQMEEMEVISPFQQRSSMISRLTRKSTIMSRRNSTRRSRRSSQRGSQGSGVSETLEEENSTTTDATDHQTQSLQQSESSIAEAEAEDKVEESPVRVWRKQTTKRISRSTSSRRYRPEPGRGRGLSLMESKSDSVLPKTLLEKADDASAEDSVTEQSHLLSSATGQGRISDTDEDIDGEAQQETVHLLDMVEQEAEVEATPTEVTALTHDTRV
ncbi:Protein unc-80-like [Holothuria leucospilota]|uniref:Protein unc-80-like n=1 Tax=Holothuria leucospilota TaxID=206669 RepID=A0A9Q1BRD8_HOLLE|nr:Protein unc-80-like [Holothuria leucospilota]